MTNTAHHRAQPPRSIFLNPRVRIAHVRVQKCLAGAFVLVLAAVMMTVGFASVAEAQQDVVGSADFRNAPQLPPGEFADRIVTGDSAWYAVVYTNDTPYEFAVDFRGPAPGDSADLTVSFVAPTLTTVDGPGSVVSGSGVAYPAGHTNVWFLKVSLETTGQVGVEYPIVIRTSGVQTFGTEPCSDTPGCTLDEDYASNNVALSAATAELEELRSRETLAEVEAEIENLRGFAETAGTFGPAVQERLARAEERMAVLCAPDPMCDEFPDPGSRTSPLGWGVGFAVLIIGARRGLRRFLADPEAEAEAEASAAGTRAKKSTTAKTRASSTKKPTKKPVAKKPPAKKPPAKRPAKAKR